MDPGSTDIFNATTEPVNTGPDYKTKVQRCSSKQYFQDSYINTRKAKIKRWQDLDPIMQSIVQQLTTIKSAQDDSFKVSVCVMISVTMCTVQSRCSPVRGLSTNTVVSQPPAMHVMAMNDALLHAALHRM